MASNYIKLGLDTGTSSSGTSFTAAGDLSGDGTSQTVIKINGATVPAAGSLTTGHVPTVTGSSALTYAYIADANVSASAAIAGTKISPNFGSQAIVTTGSTSIGTNPAAAGLIRVPTNSEILYAKAFGGTDLALLATTASDNLRIGGSSGGGLVVAGQYFHASTGNYNYHTNNTLYFTLSATTAYYAAAAGACKFGQSTVATNSATGSTLTIQAQIASGTTSTGGDLILASGTGTSTNGRVGIANVATTTSAPSAGGGGALPATPVGYFTILVNGTARQVAYY